MTRNRKLIPILASAALIAAAGLWAAGTLTPKASAQQGHEGHAHAETYDSLYVCSMHPWEAAESPDACTICGMNLSLVHGHEPGDPLPDVSELYVDPDNPLEVHEGRGGDESLIPITESPYYQPREKEEAKESGEMDHTGMDHTEMDTMTPAGGEQTRAAPGEQLWTCGMHPEVIEEEPGTCPICKMELTPLKQSTGGGDGASVRIDAVTMQNIGVRTARVEKRTMRRQIRTNGTVEVAEDRVAILNARTSGWVEKLHVARTGDRVRRGQPILEIYSPELVNTQEEFLLALRGASRYDTSSVQATREAGRMLVEAARKRLELWNISEQQIERLRRTGEVRRTLTLTAPASGHVLHKTADEGSSVKAGQNLFTIADLSSVWIEAQVYEYEAGWVREGDRVTVRSPYNPSLELAGRVDYVYPTLDPASRTLELRVVVDNEDLALRPEMYVDVEIDTEPIRGAVAVPKPALIRTGERNLVFVRTGEGLFEPREVHVGLETDEAVQITHNLLPGEEVVTSAQFLLDSEAKLQEAVQRRIARARAEGGDAEAAAGAGGHQH